MATKKVSKPVAKKAAPAAKKAAPAVKKAPAKVVSKPATTKKAEVKKKETPAKKTVPPKKAVLKKVEIEEPIVEDKKEEIKVETKKEEIQIETKTEEKVDVTPVADENKNNAIEENKIVENNSNDIKEEPVKKGKISRAEKIRALKFFLVSISAGVIQLGSTALLAFILEKCGQKTIAPAVSASIGLVLSVIWNFTFNRKFTFKSAVSIPKAMALAFLFYVFFFPAQLFATAFLTNGDVWGLMTIYHVGSDGVGWTILATVICMFFNLILEFIWQKFVVFRGSIDTNNKATK